MKKLRNKIIKIVLFSVIAVFLVMAGILYLTVNFYNVRQADLMTQIISQNNGTVPDWEDIDNQQSTFPAGFSEESVYRTRYFVVYMDSSGTVINANMESIAAVDESDAAEMAAAVLVSGKTVGFEGNYRYRISYAEDSSGFIVFLDYAENQSLLQAYRIIMIIVFAGFTLLIAAVFSFCSRYVIRPFAENARRQKQFITDASHELKTPLAIISANAQVLEYKNGKNEWLQVIRDETKHMSELIENLLELSRMQEMESSLQMESVDFSALTQETVEKFREVFIQKGCRFEENICPEICLNGNREQLKSLNSILIENASKYVTDRGRVRVELAASGKKVRLSVFNSAEMEEHFDCDKLFERFYRTDSSRSSSTGGHGIGLSIAKRIVDCHQGTIRAEKKEDGILFSVSIPGNLRVANPASDGTGKKK